MGAEILVAIALWCGAPILSGNLWSKSPDSVQLCRERLLVCTGKLEGWVATRDCFKKEKL